jgi:hypothetical protein
MTPRAQIFEVRTQTRHAKKSCTREDVSPCIRLASWLSTCECGLTAKAAPESRRNAEFIDRDKSKIIYTYAEHPSGGESTGLRVKNVILYKDV